MIYLRYSNDNGVSYNSESFDALVNQKYPTAVKGIQRTLSKSETYHVYSKSVVGRIALTIAADELYDSAKFEFLKTAFIASIIQYSFDNSIWVPAIWDGEDFPEPEYLNGDTRFPSLSFELRPKERD
jgi:zona occludens toxin (predicted ATPase)